MKCFAVLAILFGFSVTAQADIFDRINECERSGGGGCVYNIMRELARSSSGSGTTLPITGAYKRISGSTDLCEDQYLEPVIEQGRLTKVKLGWCGTRYNTTYDCVDNRCGTTGVSIEILERAKYYFTNETGAAGTFAIPMLEAFEGHAAGTTK